jgi:hypothetical protein
VSEPSEILLSTEDDPTPLVRAVRADLTRRLADPEFAELTRAARGTAAIRDASTPEAVTATVGGGTVTLVHGVDPGAQVVAVVGGGGGHEADLPESAAAEHPALTAWLAALLAPSSDWAAAAERFWAALEPRPGAPQALLVVELEGGERRRFGADGRAYEIHGRAEDLTALLEGRTALIAEAFERRILIQGSFPEISVLSGAAFEVRMGASEADG